ncbi:MAG: hypothetical protein ACFFDP_00745, partial [Promethearchaeota archaeon]
MKHQNLAIFLLLFLSFFSPIFSVPILPSVGIEGSSEPINIDNEASLQILNSINSLVPPPYGPTQEGGDYKYTGEGNASQTWEYAQGTNAFQTFTDLDNGETANASVNLPSGWTGYESYTSVYNL